MVLIQVDGLSGTGKSSVVEELRRRGYDAVDSDAVFAYFADPVTGAPTAHEVRDNWKWDGAKLREFAERNRRATVFVCGGALNGDDFAHLFRLRFTLVIDDESMRQRLQTRTNNSFGKAPAELAEQLELNKSAAETAKSKGSIVIDASRPINQVTDDIVRRAFGQ